MSGFFGLFIELLEFTVSISVEIRFLLKMTLEDNKITIHYVVCKSNKTMKVKIITVHGSVEDVRPMYQIIENKLQDRPKRLLVIINPNSGKKKGIKVYKKIAAPLFQLCDVTADVYVTSKQKQPTEILKNYNLSQIDGIVTVGGDGLYCECMNGLLSRVQQDSNVDLNDYNSNIEPASLPIGIIPAGSGDVIVQYLHGTRDIQTSVLHILLGSHVESNVVSVHEGGQLLSYSALVLGFGLFGDMMYDCEKFRWMGPARFNIVPVGCMLKRKEFDVEVEYHPSKKGEAPKRSRRFGRQISLPNSSVSNLSKNQRTKSTSDLRKDIQDSEDIVKEEGRVYAVDSHAIMMKEKVGKMRPHFGQDSLMVYTTHKCSLSEHISQLTKVKNEKPDCYEYEFVSKHEVSRYKVRLPNATVSTVDGKSKLQKDYYINCDGEIIKLKEPVFDVKLHKRVVKFYGDVED